MDRIAFSLALTTSFFLLFGCGFYFSASAPITLPGEVTRIHIREVENPTLETWIDPFLRSRFRDEFTRRAVVDWIDADPAEAQAYVILRVVAFDAETELSGAQDQTLRERATVVLETEFRSQSDDSLIWSSGRIVESETFEAGGNEIIAGQRAIENAIRRTADALGVDF